MLHPNYQRVLQLARQLPPADQQRLVASLTAGRDTPPARRRHEGDPFLALVGAWAEMGNEAINSFDAEIARQRQEPARPLVVENDA